MLTIVLPCAPAQQIAVEDCSLIFRIEVWHRRFSERILRLLLCTRCPSSRRFGRIFSHTQTGDELRAESERLAHGSGSAAGDEAGHVRLRRAGGGSTAARLPFRRRRLPSKAKTISPSRGTASVQTRTANAKRAAHPELSLLRLLHARSAAAWRSNAIRRHDE